MSPTLRIVLCARVALCINTLICGNYQGNKGSSMTTPFSFHMPEHITHLTLKTPHQIKASDSVELAYYDFVPTSPKSIMIFYHGGGAWSNRLYHYMAQQLEQKHNIGVYLFDVRGHGNSQGPRGDTPSPEQVWQDISSAIDFVHHKHPSSSLWLGGHSSGAGMVLNYSNWFKHPNVNGYVLLAPFLGTRAGTTYNHRDPAKNFVKQVRLAPLMTNIISGGYLFAHTPVIFFNYPDQERQRDQHLLESYTCTMAQATTPHNPNQLFATLDKPFILLIGANDEQFIPEKVLAYADFATHVRASSHAAVLPKTTHLSIVIDAVDEIGGKIGVNSNDSTH